jgi:hypothetical protein
LLDIEEDLNQLGDLVISTHLFEDNQLKKANERIRQLEEMVETLKYSSQKCSSKIQHFLLDL